MTASALGNPPRKVEQLLNYVQQELHPYLKGAILPGSVLLQDISVAIGVEQDIKHGLGRPHRGMMIVRATAGAGMDAVIELDVTDPNYSVALSSSHLQVLPLVTSVLNILVF